MTRCNCPQCQPVTGDCPAATELTDMEAELAAVTKERDALDAEQNLALDHITALAVELKITETAWLGVEELLAITRKELAAVTAECVSGAVTGSAHYVCSKCDKPKPRRDVNLGVKPVQCWDCLIQEISRMHHPHEETATGR